MVAVVVWPLDVALYSPGLPHDGGTLAERSLGGSETAAICVAKALAARGHHVTVFSPCQGGMWDGVEYRPIEGWLPYVTTSPHDVTIVSRDFNGFALPVLSSVRALWCHDLALRRHRERIAGLLWQVDAIYVLSEFQRRQYADVYQGVPESVFKVTRNGIRWAEFPSVAGLNFRDRNKLIYASRPERGLENALAIMDLLARRGSPYVLRVAWYDNMPPQMQAYYQALWQRAAQMPNVMLLGPLKQADLYNEMATAAALIYPGVKSEFAEVSCILAAEAMACGAPVVSIAKGAVPETVGPDAGLFVGDDSTDPHSDAHRVAFADALERLRTDDALWDRLRLAGMARAGTLDWAGVAEQWEGWWLAQLAEQAQDRAKVARHLAQIGDVEAAAWIRRQAA